MRGLDVAQLAHERVVVRVRDFRRVVLVVTLVVMRDLLAQLGRAGGRIFAHCGDPASGWLAAAAPWPFARPSRMLALRIGVSGSPRSSCNAPWRRSFRLRAVESSSSKVCCAGNGPGSTANRLRPPKRWPSIVLSANVPGLVRLAADNTERASGPGMW